MIGEMRGTGGENYEGNDGENGEGNGGEGENVSNISRWYVEKRCQI